MEDRSVSDVLLMLNTDRVTEKYYKLSQLLAGKFENKSKMVYWLTDNNRVFSGFSPLTAIREGQIERVINYLETEGGYL